ncbi:unnamed protein product, partial [Ectocarpus sp. 12 AP-2014]
MLAVAAGFLPPWVDALLSGFPFLLPLDLRLRYFRSLAFGVTRSVAYLQQESSVEERAREAAAGERAGVSRSQLLQHAEQVMSMYTPSKAVLEFRFAGEKGLGAGVTASFYSAVAAELQRRSVNTKLPMWVDNDSTGDPQSFLAPTSGLFPAPLPALAQQRRSVIGRFRFLGRLAARCLMDGQV